MQNLLTFAALGIGTGALYGLAAQGMVIIYRGSGVINFAHGAMALLSAAIFVGLRNEFQLPLIASILIAISGSALCGFLIDYLIMRRIRSASPLARLIVTLAVLGMIESVVIAFSGSHLKFVDSFLPAYPVTIAGISLSIDRLLIFAIAIIITAILWAIYKFTDFGRQTTAVAENPRSAEAMGISTNAISQINWALGAALAGLTGILLAPLTGLLAATMVLLINPVLAAALVGRFSSFPLTLLGGLLIGITQSLINYADLGSGWSSSVPFLIIISLLILRGQALPLRGFIADRLPAVGRPITFGINTSIKIGLLLLVAILLIANANEDYLAALTTSMLAAIILLSIVILTGMAGQVSLGQYAFAGIGAFVAARLADVYQWPFSLSFIAAVTTAVCCSIVFALPALRTRGVNLAIATLGLGLAIDALIFKNKDLTGGFAGTIVDAPQLLGISFDSILHPKRYAWLVLAITVACCWIVLCLRRSASGRRLLATRGNERAATSLGISVISAKLYAFAVAAAIAAAGGVLMAFRYPNVRFDAGYSAFDSIPAVLMVFLGGIGFIGGALIGGLMSMGGGINEILSTIVELNEWMGFAIGVGAITMVLVKPDGLAASISRRTKNISSRSTLALAEPKLSGEQQTYRTGTINIQSNQSLRADGISVRFGGVHALNDVSFSVKPGQIIGLIGPNGAGKTTLLDTLSGFTQQHQGKIYLGEKDICALNPTARARLGLNRSFQSLELFDDLTVEEHLRCACEQSNASNKFRDLIWPRDNPLPNTALKAAQLFGLNTLMQCLPAQLSFGQRRLLGIARAVAAQPSILMLDEPAAGLDSTETSKLGELIELLAHQWGIGILLIEHDMSLVMQHSDHIVVLNFGNKLASGSPDEIRKHPAVINAYLGNEQDDSTTQGHTE